MSDILSWEEDLGKRGFRLVNFGDKTRFKWIDKYLPKLEGKNKGKCLDVGAGSGIYKLLIESRGYEYVGIDINPRAPFPIIKASAEKIPFADNFFDVVLCIDVIEEIKDVHASTKEMHRVLKTGGILLLHTPNNEQTHILIPKLLDNPDHLRKGFTGDELKELSSGFKNAEIISTFNILECLLWEMKALEFNKIPIDYDKIASFNPEKYKHLGWLCICKK